MVSLQDAVQKISSERVTERAAGIEQYKQIFSNDSTLEGLGKGEDGDKRWLRTMQALFNCVVADRSACVRKGSWEKAAPTSRKRLQDSAAMVLWMIERAYSYFGRQTLISAINHLTTMIEFRGSIVEPISVLYLKALHCLLDHAPHVDHLTDDLWRFTISLCFNIILDERLDIEIDVEQAQRVAEEAIYSPEDSSQNTPMKTRRVQRRSRPEDVEAAHCIHALVRGSYAPLLGDNPFGATTLYRLAAVLAAYTVESSLHLPTVESINAALEELYINEPEATLQFADLSWRYLVLLWNTRGQALKEQVHLALRTLTPLVILAGRRHFVDALCSEILGEASDRLAIQPIASSRIELCRSCEIRPFQYKSIRASHRCTDTELRAWSVLELGSDLIAAWCGDGGQDAPDANRNGSGQNENATPSKRRKLSNGPEGKSRTESHLTTLLATLKQPTTSRLVQIWYIQLLLFVFLRHSAQLSIDVQKECINVMVSCLDVDEIGIQEWSFIALAAVADFPAFASVAESVWATACRHIGRHQTSRAAAHAARCILEAECIAKPEVVSNISSLLSEIEVQGLGGLSDSMCSLISCALSIAHRDVTLAQRGFDAKVTTWLRECLISSTASMMQAAMRSTLFSEMTSVDLSNLCLATCQHDQSQLVQNELHLLESATTRWIRRTFEDTKVYRYVLHSQLDEQIQTLEADRQPVEKVIQAEAQARKPRQPEARCVNLLSRVMQGVAEAIGHTTPTSTSGLNEAQLRLTISLATTSLQTLAVLRDKGVSLQHLAARQAFSLIAASVEHLRHSALSDRTKAAVFRTISVDLLLRDTSSGALHSSLSLQTLWNDEAALPALNAIQNDFERNALTVPDGSQGQLMDADDSWMGEASGRSLMEHNVDRLIKLSACISILYPVYAGAENRADALARLTAWLLDAPTQIFVEVSQNVLNNARAMDCDFSEKNLDQWIERIGSDILASYGFERAINGHAFAVDFLLLTKRTWLRGAEKELPGGDHGVQLCQFFVRQLSKGNLHWRIELKVSELVQSILPKSVVLEQVGDTWPKILRSKSIVKSICTTVNRPNVRTRFHTAEIISFLLTIWKDHAGSPEDFYKQVQSFLPLKKEYQAEMATRILVLGNLSLADAGLRPYALYHFIETCVVSPRFVGLGKAVLQSIADRLGFPNKQTLWLAFANQLVPALAHNELSLDKIPYEMLGYDTRKDWATDCFTAVAPVLLLDPRPYYKQSYKDLCSYARKSEKAGLLQCLPEVVSRLLVEGLEGNDVTTDLSRVIRHIQDMLGLTSEDSQSMEKQVLGEMDSVIAECLLLWFDVEKESIIGSIDEVDGDTNCWKVDDMTSLRKLLSPSPTFGNTKNVIKAMSALSQPKMAAQSVEVAYSVIGRMSSKVAQTHQLHEQLRMILAMQVYCSVAWSRISTSPVIMRTLLHVYSVLLQDVNLVAVVAHPLCTALHGVKHDVAGLAAVFVSIARCASIYAKESDAAIKGDGTFIMAQFETVLSHLFHLDNTRAMVIDTLCAWPCKVFNSIGELIGQPRLADFDRSLKKVKVVNVAFLKRCRDALLRAQKSDVVAFSSSAIWILIDAFKQQDNLHKSEEKHAMASVFADILYLCDGQFRIPSIRNMLQARGDSGFLAAVRAMDRKGKTPTLPLRQWIVLQLMTEARSQGVVECWDAFSTLRAVATQDATFVGIPNEWSESDKEVYRLATIFPSAASDIRRRNREELAEPAAALRTQRFDSWTCWLCGLLCEILTMRDTNRPYAHLSPLVQGRPRMAQMLLRAIVHLVFRSSLTNSRECAKDVSALSGHLMQSLRNDEADRRVWHEVIAIVLQLRQDAPTEKPLSGNYWVENVDFLLLARRAVAIHLYASALLFVELYQADKTNSTQREQSTIRDLLYAAYSNIDEPDSFYGIKNPNIRDALQRKLEHEGRWDRVFELQAAQMETADRQKSTIDISNTLCHQGFNRLALQINDTKSTDDYDSAWRLKKWDLPVNLAQTSPSQSLYAALHAVHQSQDSHVVESALKRGFSDRFSDICKVNIEASAESMRVVTGLLSLREIRQWAGLESELLVDERGSRFSFDTLEELQNVQISLLQAKRTRSNAQTIVGLDLSDVDDSLVTESDVLLALSNRAREEDKIQIASNAVFRAQQRMSELNDGGKTQVAYEEFANVLWAQGDHAMAMDALQGVLMDDPPPTSSAAKKRRAQSLARLGQWRAAARSHQALLIVKDCFQPAIKLLEGAQANTEMAEACYLYAVFADEQYRALSSSVDMQELQKVVSHRQDEVTLLDAEISKAGGPANKPRRDRLNRAKIETNAMIAVDASTLRDHERAKERFRRDAADMSARELILSEKHNNDALMRLTALWFENAGNESFIAYLRPLIHKIPSWKFLALARQLSSRLSKESSRQQTPTDNSNASLSFQKSIFDTVLRIAQDHPYHVLYSLYALARGTEDSQASRLRARASGRSSSVPSHSSSATQSTRSDAASSIIERVSAHTAAHDRIMQWKYVCDACVEWAQVDLATAIPKEFGPKSVGAKGAHVRIPLHLNIAQMRNVDVPVLTAPLEVDLTCRYASFVSIARYAERFSTAGGIHLPKICDCIGSDGKGYRQLFKDRDDLRQDAVMQQVFLLVNDLLKQDRRAKRRALYVRTYSVIPLGPRYGLLEFVGNTAPILAAWRNLYARYSEKGDLKADEAWMAMKNVRGKTTEEKRKKFDEVCAKLPPVFRYHFLERYTIPMALMQARLNYTRSVATTSIVGHILGLGDRHGSNILLDQQTGEVVHIDFGVAFDQGRLLPIPELVPFRLTRNMVDGMGLNGVEGVFRCGCQETLRVLRSGASVIKTVLNVFRYDPLYDWTQHPIKVIQAQGYGAAEHHGESPPDPSVIATRGIGTASTVNGSEAGQVKETAEVLAVRAINSVMEKLSTNLSVEYTVNDLMIRAMDHTNLASIFDGWQPAL